jgi:two-component system, cell cycle sensor histidine kinase and response regulator CckA
MGEDANTTRHRILVMDDEEAIRKIFVLMLTRLGFEPDAVSDGTQAVEKFNAAQFAGRPYRIVILDLTVREGMGGVDTIRKLREIDPRVRAIVATGHSKETVLSTYRDYGFRGIISKPFRIQEITDMIQQVLAQPDE